jgi:hypothetical protein
MDGTSVSFCGQKGTEVLFVVCSDTEEKPSKNCVLYDYKDKNTPYLPKAS